MFDNKFIEKVNGYGALIRQFESEKKFEDALNTAKEALTWVNGYKNNVKFDVGTKEYLETLERDYSNLVRIIKLEKIISSLPENVGDSLTNLIDRVGRLEELAKFGKGKIDK